MSEKRGFVAFLVTLLMPFILILVGAGMVGGGFSLGWNWDPIKNFSGSMASQARPL